MGPRETIVFGKLVDFSSGQEVTDHHRARLATVDEAAQALYRAMHDAEGSTSPDGPRPEHRFGSRKMAIANTHLETALMYVRAAIMEPG
jgi:hypothetical protein